MSRAVSGKRHEINFQFASSLNMVLIQATCVCGQLNAPARFGRTRAEEDGRDHMLEYAKQGKPTRKRGR